MDKTKFQEQTNRLNEFLTPHIQAFADLRDFTDFLAWAKRTHAQLKINTSPYIMEKILFSECLSKCLHKSFPERNHEITLLVYEAVFKNIKQAAQGDPNEYIRLFAQDVALYSVGLFPFLSYANNSLRLKVLQLFSEFYLDLGRNLIPTLPGMFSAILPLLENLEPKIKQNTRHLIDLLIQKTGRKYLMGCLWMVIIRDSGSRIGALQVVSETVQVMKFEKGEDELMESEGFGEYERMLQNQNIVSREKQVTRRIKRTTTMVVQSMTQSVSKRSKSFKMSPSRDKMLRSASCQKLHKLLMKPQREPPQHLRRWLEQTMQTLPKHQMQESRSVQVVKIIDRKASEREDKEEITIRSKAKEDTLDRIARKPTLNKLPLKQSTELAELPFGEACFQYDFPNFSSLVINAILACIQDQRPLVKSRCLDFLITHLRLRSDRLQREEKQRLVQGVLTLMIKKDIAITSRVNQWLFGKPDQQNIFQISQKNQFVIGLVIKSLNELLSRPPDEHIPSPLKILQNIFMTHQNMVELLLPDTIFPLMRWIFNFNDEAELLRTGERLFEGLQSHYSLIIQSLIKQLWNVRYQDREFELICFQVVKYIQFAYLRLMRRSVEIDDSFLVTAINRLAQVFQLRDLGESLLPLLDLFYHFILRKIQVDHLLNHELTVMIEKTDNSKTKMKALRMSERMQIKAKEQILINEINVKVGQFFLQMSEDHLSKPNLDRHQNIFRGLIMVTIQLQYISDFRYTEMPIWFSALQRAIKVKNPMIAISAISGLIDILVNKSQSSTCSSLKMLVQQSASRSKQHTKQALQKLWSLLDYPHIHSNIIDLIVSFSRCFPNFFTQTITQSFRETNEVAEKEASIRRFSHFWRLTNSKRGNMIDNMSQFSQLSKRGLYFMLDYLQDVNPLVRHASKNWLIESTSYFSRVIDPIFRDLLCSSSHKYQTDSGQVLFTQEYDTNLVYKLFRRVKSILTANTLDFLKYIYSTELSQSIVDQRARLGDTTASFIHLQYSPSVLPKSEPKKQENTVQVVPTALLQKEAQPKEPKEPLEANPTKFCYMDLLVIICLRYIQSYAAQSLNERFAHENSAVNASACELLQFLILNIESPKLSRKIIEYVLITLLKLQRFAIVNQQFVLQVQILNLYKSIFFSSSFRLKGELHQIRRTFGKFFPSKLFVQNLLMGLTTKFGYVRSQYISFVSVCLPMFADYLNQERCSNVVGAFLTAYYFLIKTIGQKSTESLEVLKKAQRNDALRGKIIALRNRILKDEQIVLKADVFRDMSSTNQILTILHGLRAILDYFFDLKTFDKDQIEFKFVEDLSAIDSMLSIVTLGVVKKEAQQRLIVKATFLHNLGTCESILDSLDQVFETVLRAWMLSKQFIRISSQELSEAGIVSFNFERFSVFNRHLRETINFLSQDREMIVSQIVYITRPLFYKFPKEIVQIYLQLWIREGASSTLNSAILPSHQKNDFLSKLIESLVVNDFPINIVLAAFMESEMVEKIKDINESRAKDKKGIILQFQQADIECKLLFFLHSYFHYSHMTSQSIKRQNLIVLWHLVLKAVRPFLLSPYPMTNYWIVDFILLVSRKYSPRQLLSEQKLKNVIHQLVNSKLKCIAEIAAKKQTFFYEKPEGLKGQKQQVSKSQPYRLIVPLSPTVYEEYRRLKQIPVEQQFQCERIMFEECKEKDFQAIEKKQRLMAFLLLKKIGLELLQNTYKAEMANRVVTRTKEWMQLIFPVIENKSPENIIFAECASQLVVVLLQKSRSLFIEQFKKNILYIFDKDDFFICSPRALQFWRTIVDWVVNSRKSDMFKDYLNNLTLESSFFTNADDNNKKRIMSFERVCFILFSGTKDRYASRLDSLISKLTQLIRKASSAHPALLILVLFCVRILFHKLSHETLKKLFGKIWPMLLTFLIQLFGRQQGAKIESARGSKNMNLLFAGLKLIETISLSGIQYFNFHQWMFIYDYFGLQMPLVKPDQELLQALQDCRPTVVNKEVSSPFYYKPYLLNYMPNCNVSYFPVKGKLPDLLPKKRGFAISQKYTVSGEEQLRVETYKLVRWMQEFNEERFRVQEVQVQKALESQFTQLDKYIFLIK